jgi:hypothetical protein
MHSKHPSAAMQNEAALVIPQCKHYSIALLLLQQDRSKQHNIGPEKTSSQAYQHKQS